MGERLVAKNRKAYFQYEIIDTYTAGIVLTGTEIKAVRAAHVNLTDGYALFIKGELWVRNIHIAEYTLGTFYNHEPRRDRKLLLKRKELAKLARAVEAKGNTIVPLRVVLTERGFAKLVIGLARGKQAHDKRETLRQRDADRELQRAKRLRF